MNLAILSDIHGNIDALMEVLEVCNKKGVERFLILGDLVGYYYHPKEVLETLLSFNTIMIQGNHERLLEGLVNGKIDQETLCEKYGCGHKIAANSLSKEQLKYLFNLPKQISLKIDNTTFSLNHGSPNNYDEYLYPNSSKEILDRCNIASVDFVLVGHSHYAFEYKCNNSILLNVGSVGQNREKSGIASWGLINSVTKEYNLIETAYDVEKVFKEAMIRDPYIKYNSNILKRRAKN